MELRFDTSKARRQLGTKGSNVMAPPVASRSDRYKTALIFIVVAVVMFASAPGFGEKLNLPANTDYSVASNGDTLGSLLNSFATNYDLIPVVSEKLYQRKISLVIDSLPPEKFMQELNKREPFVWYYDGAAIYFYDVSEMQNAVIRLNNISPRSLKRKVTNMRVWDSRFHWRQSSGDGVVYVSGPPRLIELMAQTAASLDADRSVDNYDLQIFPLKYAKAEDRQFTAGSSTQVVPGVASTLRRLMGGTLTKEEALAGDANPNKPTGLKGSGLAAQSEASEPVWIPGAATLVSIEPDPRTNSVVIYDKKERMPLYKKLITTLDQPTEQVEIEVSIMNVSTEKLRSLGVSWEFSGTDSTVAYNGVSGVDVAENQLAFQTSGGLLGAATNTLLANIEALESTGDLQVTSRPIVVTTNHLSALLDNSTTFYVRVAGQEEVDLYPVSVGAVLDVTPHIVRDEGDLRIEMDINIKDGQQNEAQVDGIPTVSTTNIVTQATVAEGESLLIGGYYYDSIIESESRVPFLHSIPLIGNLFKQRSTQTVSMSRMFLIRPKVLPGHTRTPIANVTEG